MIRITKILGINGLITLLLIIFFDVTMFNFLPDRYIYKFGEYRQKLTARPEGLGRGSMPKDYFIKHEERGFDIGRNVNANHWIDGITFPIWSNSLGCFDKEHREYDDYVYFAGDSYAWGFAPYDQTFATLTERKSGAQILKCGVTHTGQRHQFSKFGEIAKDIGKSPKAIFIFYFWNDVANDFAYPHTTVVEGWVVNSVVLDHNDELFEISREELEKRLADKEKAYESKIIKSSWSESVKRTLKYYSLTMNVIVNFKHNMAYQFRAMKPAQQTGAERPLERSFTDFLVQKNGRYWYLDNPRAQKNKEALLKFKNYSEQNNVRLSVVLIPDKPHFSDTDWYEGLRAFLDQHNIEYVDLIHKFKERNLSPNELYWRVDPHFSPLGNEIVSEILVDEYPEIFQNR